MVFTMRGVNARSGLCLLAGVCEGSGAERDVRRDRKFRLGLKVAAKVDDLCHPCPACGREQWWLAHQMPGQPRLGWCARRASHRATHRVGGGSSEKAIRASEVNGLRLSMRIIADLACRRSPAQFPRHANAGERGVALQVDNFRVPS